MNASSSSDSLFSAPFTIATSIVAIAALTATLHAVAPVKIISEADNELHLSDAQREARHPGTAQRMAAKRAALATAIAHEHQECSKRVAAFKAQMDPETLKQWRAEGIHLCDVVDGRPVFQGDDNADAAISSGTDQVRQQSAYLNVDGAGFTVGVWESGLGTRQTHSEWSDRYLYRDPEDDSSGSGDHATHVIGTIAARGDSPTAIGMAPAVSIRGFTADGELGEMLGEAAGSPSDFFDNGKLLFSNHSYGVWTGWRNGNWYGPWPPSEDPKFGQYDSSSRSWDNICHMSPYYLPFKSAGNDRTRSAPAAGASFFYFITTEAADGVTRRRLGRSTFGVGFLDPPSSDAAPNGGFDTLPTKSVAKNILTVGAINDAVTADVRDISDLTMSPFSASGPADDGRIKPDIVANGRSVLSTTNALRADGSVTSGYGPKTGTSMSTPTACGSAVLLQQYFNKRSSGGLMRAATLKGLIIHTADDLIDTARNIEIGPDYRSGWGLMNTLAAARHIDTHLADTSEGHIFELTHFQAVGEAIVPLHWDETSPEIKVTLCYTDPAGAAQNGLDNPTRNLVNDLDIVLHGPGGSISMPFILDPANPTAAATTGDNDLDNVEQIITSSPSPGGYELKISNEGALVDGLQNYSLLISGAGISKPIPVPQLVRADNRIYENFGAQPLAEDGWSYQSSGNGAGRIAVVNHALSMDDTSNSSRQAVNAATLHLDLADQDNVVLRFWWKDTHDEAHPLPSSSTGLAEGDGVSFSADGGKTWHRIISLPTESYDDWRQEVFNLTALMDSLGFTDHSDVRVRFQQFGHRDSPNDGIAYDNINVLIGNPGTLSFSQRQIDSIPKNTVNVSETAGEVVIEVQRSGGFSGKVGVDISTLDGTAIQPSDYSSRSGTLYLENGEEFATFSVPITDDNNLESSETFDLVLSSPSNGATLGQASKISVAIIDNENPPVSGVAPTALSPVALVGDDAAPQTLLISNTGGGSLNYTVKTSRPWISVASGASGSVLEDETARVKLEFATADLLPGRYSGEVILDDTTGHNTAIKVPVSLLIGFEGETAFGVNTVIPVQIPGSPDGRAAEWPLSFSIPAITGRIVDAKLLMTGFEHEEVGNLDIVLSSPSGTAVGLMSDVSNGESFGSPLPFGDSRTRLYIQRQADPLPFKAVLSNPGLYRPTDYEQGVGELPDINGAPQTWSTELGDFNGVSPTGDWHLWINDDDPEIHGGELGKTQLALRTAIIEDVIAERFSPGNLFDLNQHSLMFTPAPDLPEGYTVERYALDDFPIPPDGTVLTPPKNDSSSVTLTGPPVLFHVQEFSKILVFEDGAIGFSPDEGARISVFDSDLVTGTGAITIEELSDRVVISWVNVVDDASSEKISFGVELFHDGRIRMNYPVIDLALPGTVGLVRRDAVAWSTNFGNLSEIAPIQPIEILSLSIPEGKSDIVITSSSQPNVLYALEVSEDLDIWKELEVTEGTGGALFFEIKSNSKVDRSFYRVRRSSTPAR